MSANSTLFLFPQAESSGGVFELKVHSFTTTSSACKPSTDCQIFFRVCLKHSQDNISPEPPCTYGTGLTDIFSADQSSISNSAPIRVPFNFKWPVSIPKKCVVHSFNTQLYVYKQSFNQCSLFLQGAVSLIIEAWNAESSSEQSTGKSPICCSQPACCLVDKIFLTIKEFYL